MLTTLYLLQPYLLHSIRKPYFFHTLHLLLVEYILLYSLHWLPLQGAMAESGVCRERHGDGAAVEFLAGSPAHLCCVGHHHFSAGIVSVAFSSDSSSSSIGSSMDLAFVNTAHHSTLLTTRRSSPSTHHSLLSYHDTRSNTQYSILKTQ